MNKMNTPHYLPDETEYPELGEFLRAGGKITIGENKKLGSFAHIQIGHQIRTVDKMNYTDLTDILQEMNTQAKLYIQENW